MISIFSAFHSAYLRLSFGTSVYFIEDTNGCTIIHRSNYRMLTELHENIHCIQVGLSGLGFLMIHASTQMNNE